MRRRRVAAALLAAVLPGCVVTGKPNLPAASDRYEACTDPAFVEAVGKARALLDERKEADALPWLQKAAAAGLDHVPTQRLYQETALKLGGEAEAQMRAFYADMPDRPRSPVVPFCRARLAEDDHTRLGLLSEALARDPSFYFAHLATARINHDLGRLDLALEAMERALAARPRHLESNLEMALVLIDLGRFAQAEPYLGNYVAARPEDRLAAKTYAQLLLYRLDRVRQAAPVLERLQRENAEDPDVIMDLAAIAWRQGRFDDAVAGYHEVLRLDATMTRAALNLGNLYWERGRSSDGEARAAAWRKALKAYEYCVAANRGEGLHDTLDIMFALPYRMDLIAQAIGPSDMASPSPGVNF
ncbi:MAG: tetratricopeptide repeat protein [Planctomycetota bacterium]